MNQPKPLVAFEQLPDSAYIRLRTLVETVLPFSAATLWRKCRRGEFPPPVRCSQGVTAWRLGDVRAWLSDPANFKVENSAGTKGAKQ